MKKVKPFLIIIFFLSITLQSCSSDDDEPIVNTSSFISYKLNDTLIEESDISVLSNNSIKLIDIKGTNNSIRLWLPVELKTGTYTIVSGETDDYTATLIDNSNNLTSVNESGTITLSSVVDNKIAGTFSFTGDLNNVAFSISEGKFSATSFK
ncbi:hypothetical protein D1816_11155 [Aquimarina sp. AD10]|uniref:DUF6252 family protein n=1 Tax=Aquimarina sp. AD10 TaxID=1714849 RepID=UPI000E534417|nr:DUF6252 family protein [Aquimarina sp. AD10]AXT60879.1 hypothetical protein D1816_11155 [Aquimarina sp. AD10]RKM93044.1 hypothetical protein D7033_20290 [Aquimarina sp. AD10]